MRSPFAAFILSFFLPGAGLWYLGKRGWAIINLLVVLAIGMIAYLLLAEDIFDRYIRYLAIGCAGGSGGLAGALAEQMNKQAKEKPRGQRSL